MMMLERPNRFFIGQIVAFLQSSMWRCAMKKLIGSGSAGEAVLVKTCFEKLPKNFHEGQRFEFLGRWYCIIRGRPFDREAKILYSSVECLCCISRKCEEGDSSKCTNPEKRGSILPLFGYLDRPLHSSQV